MTAPESIGARRVQLVAFAAEVGDTLERFRAFAQAEAHPTDLDEKTRALLRALSALTEARTALQKATAAP